MTCTLYLLCVLDTSVACLTRGREFATNGRGLTERGVVKKNNTGHQNFGAKRCHRVSQLIDSIQLDNSV